MPWYPIPGRVTHGILVLPSKNRFSATRALFKHATSTTPLYRGPQVKSIKAFLNSTIDLNYFKESTPSQLVSQTTRLSTAQVASLPPDSFLKPNSKATNLKVNMCTSTLTHYTLYQHTYCMSVDLCATSSTPVGCEDKLPELEIEEDFCPGCWGKSSLVRRIVSDENYVGMKMEMMVMG